MPDELSPLQVFLWMFIANVVLEAGGRAIDVKVIWDEISKMHVPVDTNQAYAHATVIRNRAKELIEAREANS